MNFAWSDCHECLLTSMNLPNLLPISSPTPYDICSKERPQIWTQKGEWVNEIFVEVNPVFHLQSKRRLLSKLQGPHLSNHSIWYFELNLNWSILFPTSTILMSEPIFHADLRVFFRARWFCCQSERSRPKRLREHSSKRPKQFVTKIGIASSSSFVSCRFCKLERILGSMTRDYWLLPKENKQRTIQPQKRKIWDGIARIQNERKKTPTRESL